MDIKDSYLHGTIGVVKSIDINADKLIYKLADVASTTITITLPLATIIANGLMSKEDKIAINSLVNYVTLDTTLIISGAKTFSSLVEFTSEDGIAPFVVTSNTVVTNLNADRLDGLHSFDFIKYDYHIDSSTTTMSTRHIGYSYAEYGFICSGPAISIGSRDGYIMQILQEVNSSNTYIRYGNPDGFGAWKQLAFVGEATVSNADMLDGYHESAFLRYRGETGTDQESTLWHSLGIKQYINALPDGLTGVYNYGEVISLIGAQARFDMYVAHTSTNTDYEHGIWVRSGWVDDKKPWRRLAFTHDTVAAANKLSTTRYLWGQSFDGSLDVNGDMTNVGIINNYFNFQKGTGSNAVLHAESIISNVDYIHVHVANLDKYNTSRPLVLQYGYGNVGIGVIAPEHKLDVNGNVGVRGAMAVKGSIFMSLNTSLVMADRNTGIYLSDYGIHWHNSDNTWHSSIMTCDGSTINFYKPLDIDGNVTLRGYTYIDGNKRLYFNSSSEAIYIDYQGIHWHDSTASWAKDLLLFDSTNSYFYNRIVLMNTDQINGHYSGIALNFSCATTVNTSIFNGAGSHIAKFYGDSKQTRLFGNLLIGSDTNRNYIAFHGTTGDNPGSYDHTYIGENIWGTPESSELVLFKGNDSGSSATTATDPGPDRIRHIAGAHLFLVFPSALNGTFEAVCASTAPMNILAINSGNIVAFKELLPASDVVLNLGSTGYRWNEVYAKNFTASGVVKANLFEGTASKAALLSGGSVATWGTLTAANGYTNICTWDAGNYGAFSLAGKGEQMSLLLDGFFYLNEGKYMVLDTNNAKESVGEFGYVMRKYTIDASALDENTWYPVTIELNQMPYLTVRIECIVTLDSGTKPSWSTHSAGFSVRKIWEVNGYGWGTNPISRLVYVSDSSFATTDPVKGIGQLGNGSVEYVHVRGGGKYFFYTSHNKVPILRTSTYTASNLSVSPTTTVPRTILPTVDIYQQGYSTSSSIRSLPVYKQSVICTISASGTLGFADGIPEGRELHVIIKNTSSSAITITIPSTMINVMGENLKIDGNSYGELNILSCGSYYVRGVS